MTDSVSRPSRLKIIAARALAAISFVDLAGGAGCASITYGVWQIYHPAGPIVGGTFLLAGAWMTARKAGA